MQLGFNCFTDTCQIRADLFSALFTAKFLPDCLCQKFLTFGRAENLQNGVMNKRLERLALQESAEHSTSVLVAAGGLNDFGAGNRRGSGSGFVGNVAVQPGLHIGRIVTFAAEIGDRNIEIGGNLVLLVLRRSLSAGFKFFNKPSLGNQLISLQKLYRPEGHVMI